MKTLLVTGSNGLIGSEMVIHFHALGWTVRGVDNNMRADFFGSQGDTRWNQHRLTRECNRFTHHEVDMRNRQEVLDLFRELRPQAVIHAAAQPSHDLAAQRPFDDFDVNACGTLNLLEGMRRYCPEAPLVHFSSNKVYGDAPNRIRLRSWQPAGTMLIRRMRTASKRPSLSTSASILYSELPKSPRTFLCRSMDATLECRRAVCARAV